MTSLISVGVEEPSLFCVFLLDVLSLSLSLSLLYSKTLTWTNSADKRLLRLEDELSLVHDTQENEKEEKKINLHI